MTHQNAARETTLAWWWTSIIGGYSDLMQKIGQKTRLVCKFHDSGEIINAPAIIKNIEGTISAELQDGTIIKLWPTLQIKRCAQFVNNYWFAIEQENDQRSAQINEIYRSDCWFPPEDQTATFHGDFIDHRVTDSIEYVVKLCSNTYVVESKNHSLYFLIGNRASKANIIAYETYFH